jgi:hypothetical protein
LLEEKFVWLQTVTGERWTHVASSKAFRCGHGVQVSYRELYSFSEDEIKQHSSEQHAALKLFGGDSPEPRS